VKVTIIGCGNMGRAIGLRAVAGGNDVELIDRDPEDAHALAGELNAAGGGSASVVESGGKISGEVVVLAVYYPAAPAAVEQYGEQLAGKTVVEISNPIDFESFDRLVTPPDSSAAEEIGKLLPQGTPVVKAFNTAFARTIAAGEVAGEKLDIFVAGDDEDAKTKVKELIEGGGMRAIDSGPLRRARQIEHLAFLHISLQEPLGAGYGSAIKLHW
jgi:8-hydroxy-5-deazaflavin:NADPH oxidoreductase